jgi:hypothetical protein
MTKDFKVLETFYHGYRFRSRLEARWAVFFDRLGVSYRYEPEGYLLEKRGYLPDFYLPQQDCFVEIKPTRPDTEAIEKTRLLALHTRKEVYIFYGDVWFADQPLHRHACRYIPPRIAASSQANQPHGGEAMQEIAGTQKVANLLQELDDIGLTAEIQEEFITLSSTFHFDMESFRAQRYLPVFQKQYERMVELSSQLQQVHDTLVEIFTEQAGRKQIFVRQQLSWDFAWAECSTCGNLSLRNEQEEDGKSAFLHECYLQQRSGRYAYHSARLRAAYQAARQERFST